jgi:tryptophan-rich sensory protein
VPDPLERQQPIPTALFIGGAVVSAAALGGVVQNRSSMTWYDRLRKPPGQPPSWLFGPVWTVLYAGIAWNGYRLWRGLDTAQRRRARALWIGQMVTNAVWTPIFFGLRKPAWALVDQVALDTFAVALRREIGLVDQASTAVLDAYVAWLGFATYLNASIVVLNR